MVQESLQVSVQICIFKSLLNNIKSLKNVNLKALNHHVSHYVVRKDPMERDTQVFVHSNKRKKTKWMFNDS